MKNIVINRAEIVTTAFFAVAWMVGIAIGVIGGLWWFGC